MRLSGDRSLPAGERGGHGTGAVAPSVSPPRGVFLVAAGPRCDDPDAPTPCAYPAPTAVAARTTSTSPVPLSKDEPFGA